MPVNGLVDGSIQETIGTQPGSSVMAWTPLASMPVTQPLDACVLGEDIYVIGGNGGGEFWKFTPATQTWLRVTAPITAQFDGFGGGYLVGYLGNLVYFTETGDHAGHTLDYTVGTDTWTETRQPMPIGLNFFAHGLIGTKVYITAGTINGVFSTANQIYDLSTDTWTSGAVFDPPRAFGNGVAVDGLLFVFTGEDADGGYHNSLDIYDPISDEWDGGTSQPFVVQTNPPFTPDGIGIDVLNGEILIAGGSIAGTGINITVSYGPDTGIYGPLASLPFDAQVVLVVFGNSAYAFSFLSAGVGAIYSMRALETAADIPAPIQVTNVDGNALVGMSSTKSGVIGWSGATGSRHSAAVRGLADPSTGTGVSGTGGTGVSGSTTTGVGVDGEATGDFTVGVQGNASGSGALGGSFSNVGVGNSAAATTPGTVVNKIEIFDQSGNSLGFIPVYDAIT